jgi:hypothetical protein
VGVELTDEALGFDSEYFGLSRKMPSVAEINSTPMTIVTLQSELPHLCSIAPIMFPVVDLRSIIDIMV